MENSNNRLVELSEICVVRALSYEARSVSRPDPEEGLRLIGAFLAVRQPAVRQAIVTLVSELQKAYGETPWPLGNDAKSLA